MKIARAKQADFDAATDIAQLLEALVKCEPIGDCGVEGYEDCATYEAALRRAASKGSLFRVVFGMQVLCSPENGLISQTSDVLEIDQGFIDSTARQAVQTAVDALRPAFLGLARQLREVESKLVALMPATPAAAPPSQPPAEDPLGGAKPTQPTIVALPDLRPATAADLVPGAEIWYTPMLGEQPFRGVVERTPWLLGHGQVVTHVRDLEPAYSQFVGLPGARRARAACLEALFVRATPGGTA